MPKINVYLPDELASSVRDAGVPVSAVCQAALAEAVRRIGRARQGIEALRDAGTPTSVLHRLTDGLRARMTPRLVTALQGAATDGSGGARAAVGSLDLLRGLLEEGENLAVRLLLAQGVDLEALAARAGAAETDEAAPAGTTPDDSLLSRLTMPAREACAAALEAVVELGHNYLGCEHLLLGLSTGEGAARAALADHRVDPAPLRQSVRAALAGIVHERSGSLPPGVDGLAALTRRLEAVERKLAER